MGTLELAGYRPSYDVAATAAAYAAIQLPGPEECGCWYCRNWVASRDRLATPEVRELLDRLGVPADGEIEVWEVPADASGRHLYGGWYMTVGVVEGAPGAPSPAEFSVVAWRVSFTSGPAMRISLARSVDTARRFVGSTPVDDRVGFHQKVHLEDVVRAELRNGV